MGTSSHAPGRGANAAGTASKYAPSLFWVSGRSIAISPEAVALKHFVQLLGRQISKELIAYHQGRCMVAGAQTGNRQQGELTVAAGLAQADPQLGLQMFTQTYVAHDPATHAVAQ